MKKSYKRIGIWTITIAMIMGIASCGARHAHHLGMDQERIMKRVTKKLDLNTQQQDLFQEVLSTSENFRSHMQSKQLDMKGPMMENLGQEVMDVTMINDQFATIESEFSAFREQLVSSLAAFHASLNADQREKIVSIMERMDKHTRH